MHGDPYSKLCIIDGNQAKPWTRFEALDDAVRELPRHIALDVADHLEVAPLVTLRATNGWVADVQAFTRHLVEDTAEAAVAAYGLTPSGRRGLGRQVRSDDLTRLLRDARHYLVGWSCVSTQDARSLPVDGRARRYIDQTGMRHTLTLGLLSGKRLFSATGPNFLVEVSPEDAFGYLGYVDVVYYN